MRFVESDIALSGSSENSSLQLLSQQSSLIGIASNFQSLYGCPHCAIYYASGLREFLEFNVEINNICSQTICWKWLNFAHPDVKWS